MYELNELRVAYDAGLFDGEGSVFINANGRGRYVARCTMTLTTRTILEDFKARYGGSLTSRGRYGKLGRRPCWQWSVTNTNARRFLQAIRPYLVIKAGEADLALSWDGQNGAEMQARIRAARPPVEV